MYMKSSTLYTGTAKMIFAGMALAGTALLVSCESDVIDLSPVDKFSDNTAYETAERCELAMVGAYDAAQCGMYNGSWTRGYPFGAASIIQGEMRGEDMNLTAVFYDYTYSATYNTSTANNVAMWETSYEAINRYNVVREGHKYALASGVITEDKGAQYEGEALFLRGLTYHNLMVHFAMPVNVDLNNNYGMPLYLNAINTPEAIEENLKVGRSTVQQTYAQIIEDLDRAEVLLPDAIDANPITRASKGAAIALKTRVYLHMRNWDKVIEEAAKLEESRFSLEANPATPFTAFSQNKESIFSIENNSSDNASVNGAMGAMMSCRAGARAIVTSSPTLYNSTYWRGDDKRRELLLYRTSDTYYFCDKYQDPVGKTEYAPIIRYAEVLLNAAEAYARKGETDLALAKLNEVRNRSLADPATQAYTAADFTSVKDLVTAILWERRIEFHGEGRRWEDIHRLAADDLCPSAGIPAKISYSSAKGKDAFVVDGPVSESWYGSIKAIPYSDKRFLWPIPTNDIIRNPTLKNQQNTGW